MTNLLRDFNEKLVTEDIFKTIIKNESLHQDSNDNNKQCRIKKSNFRRTMFPHRNIHKYTWTNPDGETHDQIDRILIDRK